jgi:hypothetical protein
MTIETRFINTFLPCTKPSLKVCSTKEMESITNQALQNIFFRIMCLSSASIISQTIWRYGLEKVTDKIICSSAQGWNIDAFDFVLQVVSRDHYLNI